MRRRLAIHPLNAALTALALTACAGAARREPVTEYQRPAADSYVVQTPVRAQLVDGSVVLYREGVTVTADALQGPGTRFSLSLSAEAAVTRVPFDSVVALVSVTPLVLPPKKGLSTEASVPITMGLIIVLFTVFAISGSK
jgi:hypothetical protein